MTPWQKNGMTIPVWTESTSVPSPYKEAVMWNSDNSFLANLNKLYKNSRRCSWLWANLHYQFITVHEYCYFWLRYVPCRSNRNTRSDLYNSLVFIPEKFSLSNTLYEKRTSVYHFERMSPLNMSTCNWHTIIYNILHILICTYTPLRHVIHLKAFPQCDVSHDKMSHLSVVSAKYMYHGICYI